MRRVILAALTAASLAGCATGERVLERPQNLVARWSFDQSCTSEGDMHLLADGNARYGVAQGNWWTDRGRIFVLLRTYAMGDPRNSEPGRTVSYTFQRRSGFLVSVDGTTPALRGKRCEAP